MTIAALNTFGQEDDKFNIRLKFHPFALAAISRPTVLGSVEFKLNQISIDLAYGQQYGFLLSSQPDTQRVENYGNQYRVDLKYYFKQFKKNDQIFPFMSIGYCKMYTQRNLTQDWFSGWKFDPGLAFIDNIHVFCFNYGISKYFGRIVAEGVIGSGVRFRTQELVYANRIVYDTESRVRPHLSVSFRIGYILTKTKKRPVTIRE